MDTTTKKTTLLRTIIDHLNDPSADRYSAVVRQRTFGRARLAETKVPTDRPERGASPALGAVACHSKVNTAA